MSRCLGIIAIFFICEIQFATAQPGKVVKWVVEKNSIIRVQGRSNVNSFTCNTSEYAKKDTIFCYQGFSKSIKFTGEIQMDILSFNCHSSMITAGLRNTLKADKYPQMIIRFISLQYMPFFQNKIEVIKGLVEVQLAGVVKRFELDYSFLQSGSDNIQLNGRRSFRFSDFKLSPPQKFAGLIKIKDDFDVHFHLTLRTI
ncbi:MAG: hypothetical protein ABIO04_07400 [Ferruginibacter sp.]